MYRIKICNQIKLVYFLKFVVHEINFEIVKSGMVVLTGREKADVTDANMTVGWMLEHCWLRGREKPGVTWSRLR
jgi:hypothetical protein